MRARNERDLRARRGHYSLRDLVGLADIERLLANDVGGERLSLDADDDEPAGAFATFHTTGKGGGYEDQDIEQLANALQAFAALQDEDP